MRLVVSPLSLNTQRNDDSSSFGGLAAFHGRLLSSAGSHALSPAFAYSRLGRLSPQLSTPSVSARADLPEAVLFSTFLHASGSFPYRLFLHHSYLPHCALLPSSSTPTSLLLVPTVLAQSSPLLRSVDYFGLRVKIVSCYFVPSNILYPMP